MSLKHLFSHFVTPSFSRPDRTAWCKALGLENVPFLYVETSGTLVLRAARIQAGEVSPLLTVEEDSSIPLWKIEHESHLPVISPAWGAGGMWETLFPYPLCLLPLLLHPREEVRLQISPADSREEWFDVYKAFRELEERMARTEISCLWIRPAAPLFPMPVLTHFVRRRCVRVGTAPHLLELGETYERGELSSEFLGKHFGTQAAFFVLDLTEVSSSHSALVTLTRALQQAVQNPENAVEFRLHREEESEFRL